MKEKIELEEAVFVDIVHYGDAYPFKVVDITEKSNDREKSIFYNEAIIRRLDDGKLFRFEYHETAYNGIPDYQFPIEGVEVQRVEKTVIQITYE